MQTPQRACQLLALSYDSDATGVAPSEIGVSCSVRQLMKGLRISALIAVGMFTGCPATMSIDHVDWSATGSMLAGAGAILAAAGSIFIIWLTARYVRINSDLLRLNHASLEALREYVAATRDMADIMRHQMAVAGADIDSRIELEHEPFRHLLDRMIAGCERVKAADLITAFRSGMHNLRPDESWYLPADYSQKVQIAQNLDGTLHTLLQSVNDPVRGELTLMNRAIAELARVDRPEYANVPEEVYPAAQTVKNSAQAAVDALLKLRGYVDQRAARLKIQAHQPTQRGA